MTASKSGKFYVGRHTTRKLNDKYYGSGKWVRDCLRNKVELHKQILYFYEDEESLREAEEKIIAQYIDHPNCMNFNTSSCGFSSGKYNPSRNPEVVKKRWQNQKGVKTNFNYDNPSCKPEVKVMRSERAKEMWKDENYRLSKSGDNNHMKKEEYRKFISENNPMHKESAKKKISEFTRKQYSDGTHNFQKPEIKAKALKNNNMKNGENPMFDPMVARKLKKPKEVVTCPHCNKSGGKPVMCRYHFDNCKSK